MPLTSSARTTTGSTRKEPRPADGRRLVARPLDLKFKIVADLLALSLAFAAALKLRLSLGGVLFVQIDAATLDRLTPPVWLVLVLWLISGWRVRLYRPRNGFGPFDTVVQVVEAVGLATALTVVLSFLLYEYSAGLSRAFFALFFVVGVTGALALRAVLWLIGRLTPSIARPEHVLIVGDSDDTLGLANRFLHASDRQVAVLGVISTGSHLTGSAPAVPVLGTLPDLRRAINETRADRVLIIDADLPLESLAECIDVCGAMHIPLNCSGGGLTRLPTVVELTEVAGVRMLEVHRPESQRTQDLIKRTVDIAVAGLLLVAALPFFAVLAIAVKWSSPGPVLFVSDRVGRGGRHFRFLKFRSMVSGAEALRPTSHPHGGLDGHIFKVADDSRITGVGRLMRRLSLDELPQLFNVVRGDMSLVGPRPLPACDLDVDGLSARHRVWSVERSTIRPGITGLWQVRGRSGLSFDEMVRLDLLYARTRSYRLDMQVLLETIPAVLTGRGAM